jgi:DNA-binding GntR family transcriptional regulator
VTESQYRARGREATSDPRPWVQLKNLLAAQMEDGILEPGDEVAVTLEAQDFGINQRTARKALRALVAEGRLIPPGEVGKSYTVAGRTEGE